MQVGEAQELLGEPVTAYCVPRKMYAALAPQIYSLMWPFNQGLCPVKRQGNH